VLVDGRLVALGAVVLLAFAVEATIGFGATVVAIALGAFLLPIDALLPVFLPLNGVLSAILVARELRHVDWRRLLREVLPWMALGVPIGAFALVRLDPHPVRVAFGVFVVVLAAIELRRAAPAGSPPPRAAGRALLVLAGVLHGAFATGGPAVVYVLGRTLDDKRRLRATLCALWLLLNLVLITLFAVRGELGRSTLVETAKLAPFMLAGLAAGELLHRRVPEALFRRIVFAFLGVAGVVLAAWPP
jgi:uncharacterized membrane protein YfcA